MTPRMAEIDTVNLIRDVAGTDMEWVERADPKRLRSLILDWHKSAVDLIEAYKNLARDDHD